MLTIDKLAQKYVLIFVLLAYICLAYLPLIFEGGIIVDDWGDISHNLSCNGFFNCYLTWFPLFSNRPLAPLPITLSTFLFQTHFSLYLILNSFLYLLSIFITARIISYLVGNFSATTFILIAAIPCIAMPLIASPINQLTATLSFVFWATSLNSLFNYCFQGKNSQYLLAYLLLLCGFLTYEVILPLLVLSALLPHLLDKNIFNSNRIRYLVKYILPILLILVIVILWQKIIAPQFMEVDSRLKFEPSQILAKIHTWAHVFYAQLPSLFLKSIDLISTYDILSGIVLVATFYLSWRFYRLQPNQLKGSFYFVLTGILCFFASSLIFILSGESATSWGYQARGLSSTWFAFAILLSGLVSSNFPSIPIRNYIFTPMVIIVTCLSLLVFSIQRDNYVKSWKLQQFIIKDALNLIKLNKLTPDATVIGNVPKFLNPNFNDEIVFSQSWDFGAALSIYTQSLVISGAVIDSRRGDFKKVQFQGDSIILDGWWKGHTSNMWFYDFDPAAKKGTIIRVKDINDLKNIFDGLQMKPIL